MRTKKYIIYCLWDPRDGEIRYVGQSRYGIKRAKTHSLPSSLKRNYHVHSWIKQLLVLNLRPQEKILEEFNDDLQLNEAEVKWISILRNHGHDLTNIQEGGGSYARTKPFSVETRNKMRMAKLGKKLSHSHVLHLKQALSRRPPVTEETKMKISKANKGKPKPESMRKFFKENNPMAKKVICLEDGRVFKTVIDAARAYGVTPESVSRVCKGKYKSVRKLRFQFTELPTNSSSYDNECPEVQTRITRVRDEIA